MCVCVCVCVCVCERDRGLTLRNHGRDFPGGPVAKILHPNAWGLGSIPGQGTKSHMPQLESSPGATKTPPATVLCLVAQSCPALCDPMNCSPPGSSFHGDSSGKNTGVGCHALLLGIFPNPGIEPKSPSLQADSLPTEPPGKPTTKIKDPTCRN